MSEHTPEESPAGWYPDPGDPALRRYWDGSAWTAHTALAQAAQPPALQPHDPRGPKRAPPPSDRGFFGWVSRRPRPAFWATLAAALIVGMGVGAAAVQEDGAQKPRNDSGALTEANEELSDARAGRKAAEKKLSKARDALEATEGQAGSTGKRRAPRPMASSSGGAVQSFSGNGARASEPSASRRIRCSNGPTTGMCFRSSPPTRYRSTPGARGVTRSCSRGSTVSSR